MQIIKKTIKYIVIVFVFSPLIVCAQYSELFEPSVPKHISIRTQKQVAQEFTTLIKRALSTSSENIPDEFKKKLEGEFIFNDGADKNCIGKFRLNGDWKDHIDSSKNIASLDVSLSKNCFIGGISNFKLFLPRTRGGFNEVFWTTLLDYYGFPTLYTRIINVDFNGVVYQAIFQEKPSTSFLERHGIRETPIIKHDERQLWSTRKEWFQKNSLIAEPYRVVSVFDPAGHQQTIDGIKINHGDFSYGELFNSEFLDSELRYRITLNALTSFRNKNKLVENAEFYDKISKSYAAHGMYYHNRRFIYNSFTDSFIPLYYDGDVDTFESAACELNNQNSPTERFVNKYLKLTGENLTDGMRCVFARVHDLKYMSTWSIQNIFIKHKPISIEFTKVGNLETGIAGIQQSYLYSENYVPHILNPNNKSKTEINNKKLKSVLTGNSTTDVGGYTISTVVAGEKYPIVKTQGAAAPKQGDISINVPEGVKYYLYVPEGGNRRIFIKLAGLGSRVLFTGKMSNTDKIIISGNAPNITQNDRHDDQMITGCATFYKFNFSGGSLYSDATGCEDSINIMSSAGSIDKITVRNATADALDLDFSNIEILTAEIETAGNDCIDISSGTYHFDDAKLSNCGDKGVSVGERSTATIKNVVIDVADIGIAVKDESNAKINRLNAYAIKSRCIDSYVKKSKFGTPLVSIDNQVCGN